MTFSLTDIKGLQDELKLLFEKNFSFSNYEISDSLATLSFFTKDFKPNIYVGIESVYVDKLYRASYYDYYSSKLSKYQRDCIRLSFFDMSVKLEDFYSEKGFKKLNKSFLGFLVSRPISPNIIGRNILRPDIYNKTKEYFVTVTKVAVSIYGLKLNVEGFPHASQDSELMVCAETTLWSLMEYFSNRYPDYKPVLPREINRILSYVSMQRQVPSRGLTGIQISYALKELGFGVKLYSSGSYTGTEFYRMIQIYIESGIPVVAAISNKKGDGHVFNIVGRTQFNNGKLFTFADSIVTLKGGSLLYDFYEQPADYLVVDDNHPPYSNITLQNPASNYSDVRWNGSEIIAAIVPLHRRIYMEADRAKELATQQLYIIDQYIKLPSFVLKVFLSSSRTFKHQIATNPNLGNLAKTVLLSLELPKFVWIAELTTPDLITKNMAAGMILMDATEPKKLGVLASLLEKTYIGDINGTFSQYSVPLPPFRNLCNLTPF